MRDAQTGKRLSILLNDAVEFTAFTFAPDGESVGVALANIVKIWETNTGRLAATLTGHDLAIKSVEFSPNSRQVVTSSVDNTAAIWDTRSGHLILRLRGHSASVTWAGFSPDGNTVLTVGNDRTARLWEVRTGREVVQIKTERALSRGRFSPDGRRVLIFGNLISAPTFLGLYATDGTTIASWNKKSVMAADFDEEGKDVRVVTPDEGGLTLRAFSMLEGESLYTISGHTELVGIAEFSSDRRHLLTAGFDRSPRIWNASTGDLEGVLNVSPRENSLSRVTGLVDFSPDGRRVLLLTSDGTLTICKTTVNRIGILGHSYGLFRSSYSPNGSLLFSADRNRLLIRRSNGNELLASIEPPESILHVFFNRSGSRVLTTGPEANAYLWSIPGGHRLMVVQGHSREIVSADFSPGDLKMVTAGADGMVIFWDLRTGARVHSLPRFAEKPTSVQFSPDGSQLLTTSLDGSVIVWDATNDRRLCVLIPPGEIRYSSARFSPDGRIIVTGGKHPRIWARTCRLRMELPPQEDAIIEGFSADSSRFTTAGFGEPVRIWNAGDGSLQATLQESQFLPGTVRFSPDGVWVLVSGVGNTNTKLWDSETGRFVYSFGGKAQVGEAEFSPTGREIVTASTDGELDIWDLRLERRRPEWILNQIRTMTSWELKGNLVYQKKNQPVPLER